MTKEQFINDIQIYRQTDELIAQTANRWVRAWKSSYYFAEVLYINYDNMEVLFEAKVSGGGIYIGDRPIYSFSLNYIIDDKDLEKDAAMFWENKENKKREMRRREDELENHPIIKEYKEILKKNGREFFVHTPGKL